MKYMDSEPEYQVQHIRFLPCALRCHRRSSAAPPNPDNKNNDNIDNGPHSQIIRERVVHGHPVGLSTVDLQRRPRLELAGAQLATEIRLQKPSVSKHPISK